MDSLKFSDGMSFNTQGPYRVVHKSDGWYVVGHGMLLPVDSAQEGHEIMVDLIKSEGEATR